MIVLSTNASTAIRHPHAKLKKKLNLDTDLISTTKINSKCITDLNTKYKTRKLLELT